MTTRYAARLACVRFAFAICQFDGRSFSSSRCARCSTVDDQTRPDQHASEQPTHEGYAIISDILAIHLWLARVEKKSIVCVCVCVRCCVFVLCGTEQKDERPCVEGEPQPREPYAGGEKEKARGRGGGQRKRERCSQFCSSSVSQSRHVLNEYRRNMGMYWNVLYDDDNHSRVFRVRLVS